MTTLEKQLRTKFALVESVRDAIRRVAIEVTKQDLKAAKPQKHGYCAMAEAAREQIPGVTGVLVSTWSAYLILRETSQSGSEYQ